MSAVPQIVSVIRAKYGCVAPVPASEVANQAPEAEAQAAAVGSAAPVVLVSPEIAFYRKYTEALLRRYLRCSMEAGKVPSLMGKEMFRSKVSSYRMKCFEDIVIFTMDVEKCLSRLDEDQQEIIARIVLQEYTILEMAAMLNLSPKTVVGRFREAIDRLTRIFLNVKMLEPKLLVKKQEEPELEEVIECK
jgi:hypothetical protein